MSTYSTSLQIQLIANGDQSGIWGTTTNTNWNLVEQAIAGVQAITMLNADYTLTVVNGASDEARNAVLVVTGTNSDVRKIVAPLVPKTYLVCNNTTGGYSITIGGSTGSVATILNGSKQLVYCDGTSFYSASVPYTGYTGTGSVVLATSPTITTPTISSPTLTGTPVAPTASPGTNTTQIATTAFVTAATGTLGTMSTQNANNVSITGGTITGNYGLNSGGIYNSGGWSVTPSGTKLYFSYNGVNKGSLDSSGNFIAIGNVTAYGTP